MGSEVPFIACICTSIFFFVFSNVYLVIKQFKIAKMIRDSGQVVSSYPLVILQNISVGVPQRPDIISPDAVRPPPSYNEAMTTQMPKPGVEQPPSYS